MSSSTRARARLLAGAGCVALVLVVGSPASSLAQASPEGARATVETAQRRARSLLSRAPSEARDRELDTLFESLLDFEALTDGVLGLALEERTPDERRRFGELLHALLEQSYRQNLVRTLRYDVRVVAVEARDDTVIVRTEARSRKARGRRPIVIEYALHEVGGAYRVFDVTTDGLSLVQAYRTQVNRILAREGFAALLARMEAKLEPSASSP